MDSDTPMILDFGDFERTIIVFVVMTIIGALSLYLWMKEGKDIT